MKNLGLALMLAVLLSLCLLTAAAPALAGARSRATHGVTVGRFA